jgi:hypothetical protein
MSLLEDLAIYKYVPNASLSFLECVLNNSKACTMLLRGFLNSCAAYAKAKVFIEDIFFCLSTSIHADMSLIVTISRLVDPTFIFCENTCRFFSQGSKECKITSSCRSGISLKFCP